MHWHGLAVRNDMDGAAPATPNVNPGSSFTYRFSSPLPGDLLGPSRTPAWTPTTASTFRSSSMTRTIRATTTPSGSSCSTTGPRGSAAARNRSTIGLRSMGGGGKPGMGGMGQMPGMGGMGDMGHMPGMGGMGQMPGMGRDGPMPGTPGVGGAAASQLLGGDGGDVSYPTTSSTAASPEPQPHSAPNPGSASGSGSSTPEPTPPSGSPWPDTA